MLGVNDRYADTGPYEPLLSHLGLQGEQIAETVEKFIGHA
jgi:transketolase C-terminal domain/subunit